MIDKLEHVTIRVVDLDRTIAFYTEVIGLVEGDRPPFDFPGAWLYAGETPVVHLVAGRDPGGPGTGTIDHIGLTADDFEAAIRRLAKNDVPFDEREVPGLGLRQIFVEDPNGVRIELNFPLENRPDEAS